MKYAYPAVFVWVESDKVYSVKFPDVEGCFTYGENLIDALEMATDVLNLSMWSAEKHGDEIPAASKIEDIKLPNKNSFVQYIFADTEAYAKMLSYEKILEAEKIESA